MEVKPSETDFRSMALEYLKSCAKTGIAEDGYHYFYTSPNNFMYPHQWFWDSCFQIMVNCELNRVEEADLEFDALIHFQEPSGFIGHMNYWLTKTSLIDSICKVNYPNPNMSNIIQPPFLAHALQAVYKHKNKIYLEEYIQQVSMYFDFLAKNRVVHPESNALISIIHPWESGMDNVVAYDHIFNISGVLMFAKWMIKLLKTLKINAQLKWDFEKIVERDYFIVEDPLVNSVYADGLQILSTLWKELGNSENAKKYGNLSSRVANDIITKMWDVKDGFFYYRRPVSGDLIKVKTVAGFTPLNLESLPDTYFDRLIKEHLLNPREFACEYPIPSTAKTEKGFSISTKLLWRGPSWISTNWYVCQGLNKHRNLPGINDVLNNIIVKSEKMVAEQGFWEYYNCFTAKGGGAKGLGWSTLINIFPKKQ